MITPIAAVASESTAGAPIAVGTTDTLVHDTPTDRPDDVLLCLVNITAGAVLATVTIAGGTPLVVSVPAQSQAHVGPFGVSGQVEVAAGAAASIYALVSIRR
jgi:hypothetical protein